MQIYTHRITFSCDDDTKKKLKILAEKENASASWIVRKLVNAAYEAEFWRPEMGINQSYSLNSS